MRSPDGIRCLPVGQILHELHNRYHRQGVSAGCPTLGNRAVKSSSSCKVFTSSRIFMYTFPFVIRQQHQSDIHPSFLPLDKIELLFYY